MFSQRSEVFELDGHTAHASFLSGRVALGSSLIRFSSCAYITHMQNVRQSQFQAAVHLNRPTQDRFHLQSFAEDLSRIHAPKLLALVTTNQP